MPRQSAELISLTVRPRSSRSRVELGPAGALVVRVHSAAVDDAANREFLAVVAKALGVAKSSVQLIRGARSRDKQIAVAGMSATEARARLERSAQGDRP